MTCPNCHAEVGEGKKFCGKCGAPIRATEAPHVGTISPERRCPKCGTEVQPGKRFCGRCGSTLTRESFEAQQPQQIPAAATAPTPLSPPALSTTVTVQPATPPIEEKPCPHCGAPVGAGAKFCKQCGKPPSEGVPRAATPILGAGQAHDVPLAAAVSRPYETARLHPPPARSKKGALILVAGLSSLVVLGAAIGYVKIYKRAASKQASMQLPSPTSSATSGTAQPVSPGAAPPSTAPTEAQSASQASQPAGAAPQTPMSPRSVGEPPPAPSTSKRTKATAETAPPPPPVPPPYQQAHENAEQALAAQRYIEPPDDSALSWARRARQQGDPEAAQIEQQVLDSVTATVRAARATQNYGQATALLGKLGSLFPDHPEIEQMSSTIRQEQQEHAKELERQRQAAVFQAQTKQFPLRHRHLVGMQGFRPVYSYCEGSLEITPDGIATFDCTRTADPGGHGEHIVLNAGDIKEVRPNRDGSIRLATTSSGNLDFYGDPSAVQGSLNALQILVRR